MRLLATVTVMMGLAAGARAEDPCVSGLPPGQRPGPYAAVVSTGPERGKSHCFICETADRPAVIIFARTPDAPLGKLAAGLDVLLQKHKEADLRGWVTFLSADEAALSPQVVNWSRTHGLKGLPAGVFEDADGPPAYRLSRDAEVTVLLYVKQKVVRNFAFRASELTDRKAAEILAAVPELLPRK